MALERFLLIAVSGLFIAIIGYLIKYRGMVQLVAGYDPDEVVNEAGLGNFIGTLAIVVGAVTIMTGILDYQDIGDGILWYVFGVFVVGSAGVMVVGANRYTA
ncbi:DUF3784 domain-containing protein [Halococcus thailandensis]|uniref:DUF3784 domain-containing protein n=1 Tax=Halococcus thailandensis JCM 13552 TaxID=1227457 RepID=M0NE29_9EURY|nr:DUF3784 domain-containing protein [Halococcus thailandensis]EMA55818.1 hypothetical protein C451_05043 [Halococcus thailandensis JCM 13552]